MNICQSCGGILGRDCFNPIECAQITQSLEINQQSREICIRFLESIRAYEHESGNRICDDERSTEQLFEIFINNSL